MKRATHQHEILRFLFIFLLLFGGFYLFTLVYAGLCAPGGFYSPFLDEHLNYIEGLRSFLLYSSAHVLRVLGYHARTSSYELLVVGHTKINLAFSCLGFGLMSFFAAFVIAWPEKWRRKLLFLFSGLVVIQMLNILRFVVLSLYWHSASGRIGIDHHILFNTLVYLLIGAATYLYIGKPENNRDARTAA